MCGTRTDAESGVCGTCSEQIMKEHGIGKKRSFGILSNSNAHWAVGLVIAISIGFGLVYLNDFGSSYNTQELPTSSESSVNHIRAVNYFKGPAEPAVVDAIWSSDQVFRVGMLNDGTDKSGFANYICQVLASDFDIRGGQVQVIDIAELANSERWERLGRSYCD
tara:strand:+ start:8329 stop:8820 length:492 start_codon:yes stop_codon:yes gene_type:complete